MYARIVKGATGERNGKKRCAGGRVFFFHGGAGALEARRARARINRGKKRRRSGCARELCEYDGGSARFFTLYLAAHSAPSREMVHE